MRCFIACFVEGGTVGLQHLRRHVDGARWLPPGNLHVTLRFLGEIDETEVPRINQLIASLSGTQLRVTVSCLDGFPRRRRARVVVARLGAETGLDTWAHRLAETLGEPDKPFVAHVTLGRSRGGTSIPQASSPAGFEIMLSTPALYESVPDASGVTYRRIDCPRT